MRILICDIGILTEFINDICLKISYDRSPYLKNHHDKYQYMCTWYMVTLRYMEYRSRSVNLVFAQKEAQIFFM